MQDATWLDNFKLRASYSQAGNDNVGDFEYLTGYSIRTGDQAKYIIGDGAGLLITRNGYFVASHDIVRDLRNGKIRYKGKDYGIERVMDFHNGLALVKATLPGAARAIPMRLFRGQQKDDMKIILYGMTGDKYDKKKGRIPKPNRTIPYQEEDGAPYSEGLPRVPGMLNGLLVTPTGSLFGVDARQGATGTSYIRVDRMLSLLKRFVNGYSSSTPTSSRPSTRR